MGDGYPSWRHLQHLISSFVALTLLNYNLWVCSAGYTSVTVLSTLLLLLRKQGNVINEKKHHTSLSLIKVKCMF